MRAAIPKLPKIYRILGFAVCFLLWQLDVVADVVTPPTEMQTKSGDCFAACPLSSELGPDPADDGTYAAMTGFFLPDLLAPLFSETNANSDIFVVTPGGGQIPEPDTLWLACAFGSLGVIAGIRKSGRYQDTGRHEQ
jgi:hypothetical protein